MRAATLVLTAALLTAPAAVDDRPVPSRPTLPSVQQAPDDQGWIAVSYTAPVEGPVTDPFRPPASPYGPGNRGLEHATEPGSPVGAAAAGTVTFAGQVGGTLHVTVSHADGARTTYSGLATISVTRGALVDAAEPVGTAGHRLLWTVRLGDAYLDPAVLLAASGQVRPHLVPVSADWPLEPGLRTP